MPVLLLAASLYLDDHGVVVSGEVTGRRETISFESGGHWTRRLVVDVRYRPREAPLDRTASIGVDELTYDRLVVGSPAEVRYLPLRPNIARLATQSTLSVMPWILILQAIVITSVVPLVWLWLKVRPLDNASGRAVPLLVGGWGVAVLLGVARPEILPGPSAGRAATAHVRAIEHVTESVLAGPDTGDPGWVDPYDLVLLEFVPTGSLGPVVAVDGIDTGSIPSLAVGDTVAIAYVEDQPREARMLDGSRDHRWRNVLLLGLIALVWVLFGTALVMARNSVERLTAWVRARAARRQLRRARD